LRLGFLHIADWEAYDHIVFVATLCAAYLPSNWKRVLGLTTAFTIGHSITLALSVFKIVIFPSNIIEVFIPITILITSIFNGFNYKKEGNKPAFLLYLTTLTFGFIHGCGFSNYLNTLLIDDTESIWQELLSFNIGLEIGQLIIVIVVLSLSFVFVELFHVEHSKWKLFMAATTLGIAIYLFLKSIQIIS
jgi:hypothetical protein